MLGNSVKIMITRKNNAKATLERRDWPGSPTPGKTGIAMRLGQCLTVVMSCKSSASKEIRSKNDFKFQRRALSKENHEMLPSSGKRALYSYIVRAIKER
jgi:hypothetical protein